MFLILGRLESLETFQEHSIDLQIYIEICKVVLRKKSSTLNWGGGGLLIPSKNHHKISLIAGEDHLLNEGVLPLV